MKRVLTLFIIFSVTVFAQYYENDYSQNKEDFKPSLLITYNFSYNSVPHSFSYNNEVVNIEDNLALDINILIGNREHKFGFAVDYHSAYVTESGLMTADVEDSYSLSAVYRYSPEPFLFFQTKAGFQFISDGNFSESPPTLYGKASIGLNLIHTEIALSATYKNDYIFINEFDGVIKRKEVDYLYFSLDFGYRYGY